MKPGDQTKRLRRKRLHPFAAALWLEWRRLNLPVATEPVLVAVSGGADSTALLLAIDELVTAQTLSVKVLVVHLDHSLRSSSRRDALAVARLSKQLGYQTVIGRTDVQRLAAETGDNLEQAARRARFAFFERTAKKKRAQLVLLAHTMDDQAETVLLRLVRGSSSEGLSGMQTIRNLDEASTIRIARPLLSWARRAETEAYCCSRNTQFIVDEMNLDERFARVKVRRHLLPLMKSLNNKIVETLFRTSTLLHEDSATLASNASELLKLAIRTAGENHETHFPALDVDVLSRAPAALRRRALRRWLLQGRGDLRRLEHIHLLGVERLLEGTKGGRVAQLPGGASVRRKHGRLELIVKKG